MAQGKKKVVPSEEGVRRARLHPFYQASANQGSCFRVLSSNCYEVVFLFGGHEIRFWWEDVELVHNTPDPSFVTKDDFDVLEKKAKEEMETWYDSLRRFNELNKLKKAQDIADVQPELPL